MTKADHGPRKMLRMVFYPTQFSRSPPVLMTLAAQGKYVEAETLLVRATTIFECSLGPDNPKVVSSLISRGGLLEAQVGSSFTFFL